MCNDPDYWLVAGEGGESLVGWLAWYGPRFCNGLEFPAPWLSGSKQQREDMVAAVEANVLTVLQISEIKTGIKERLKYAQEQKLRKLLTGIEIHALLLAVKPLP